jgi:hypothetical protein
MGKPMPDHIGHAPVPAVDPRAMYPGRPAALLDALESKTLSGGEPAEDGRVGARAAEDSSPTMYSNGSEPPD